MDNKMNKCASFPKAWVTSDIAHSFPSSAPHSLSMFRTPFALSYLCCRVKYCVFCKKKTQEKLQNQKKKFFLLEYFGIFRQFYIF